MNNLLRIGLTLIGIIILVNVTTMIFNFFDIGFEIYGMYLIFIIALALFYAFLPKNATIFDNMNK